MIHLQLMMFSFRTSSRDRYFLIIVCNCISFEPFLLKTHFFRFLFFLLFLKTARRTIQKKNLPLKSQRKNHFRCFRTFTFLLPNNQLFCITFTRYLHKLVMVIKNSLDNLKKKVHENCKVQ